jgi:predicted NUDIX family phosphoesterase
MSKYGDQSVLCVPTACLARRDVRPGYHRFAGPVRSMVGADGRPLGWAFPADTAAQIIRDSIHYVARERAEEDEDFRQVIPYCLVRAGDDRPGRLLTYRRRGGCEGRLEGERSIGWGGHVERCDTEGRTGLDGICAALVRELREELRVAPADYGSTIEWRGLLDDGSNPVGRVHLGVVASIVLSSAAPALPSPEHVECGFRTVAALRADVGEYETWSRLIIKDIYEKK